METEGVEMTRHSMHFLDLEGMSLGTLLMRTIWPMSRRVSHYTMRSLSSNLRLSHDKARSPKSIISSTLLSLLCFYIISSPPQSKVLPRSQGAGVVDPTFNPFLASYRTYKNQFYEVTTEQTSTLLQRLIDTHSTLAVLVLRQLSINDVLLEPSLPGVIAYSLDVLSRYGCRRPRPEPH